MQPPIFIVGATGTGKSAAAMEVARDWARTGVRPAILCMDAMQVYRGAGIGTSKLTAPERAEVPHGGLDLIDFGQPFDVAQYLKHAGAFLREQSEAGRRVIVVGGTGLYFRALTQGLCEAPQGSDELRAELSSLSVAELRERLRKIDPVMLERVDAANPRRLARAIEVMEATGKSLRTWQEETPEPLVREFTAWWIQREKAELSQRIEARVEGMFAAGWVEEVRGLIERHGYETVRNFAGIGYREIAEAMELRGQVRSQVQLGNEGTASCDLAEEGRKAPPPGTAAAASEAGGRPGGRPSMETLKRDILVATRQYAKRQLTWFAQEPNLQKVMLTGDQSTSAAMRAALL
jgi:tRNA dimethylallyltransferase